MPEPTAPAAPPRASAYDPQEAEPRWYRFWEDGGFFRADAASGKPPFVVPMPPPNVTGRLHMGHALQDAVQDALVRMRRMQGFEALWIPGMDHAGIATQNVVERELKKGGESRQALGREAFVARVRAWKEEYGGIILQQKRRLGCSCDWSRERYTMDDGFTRAIQTVFVKLFEDGLVYRGDYLVNWDPENRTAISDEEVDNVERAGVLYYVRYPVVDESGEATDEHLTIATTRPETIPADAAVAVHPDDENLRHLVGRRVLVPTTGRAVPVIADAAVELGFGTGALKVTPAHDRNDFEIGQRHGLPVINVMNPDATLNEEAGAYAGLDRFVARERIVADLDAAGLLEKTEPHKGTVPVSSRSKAVIEPLVSRQWFVKMKPLAAPALDAVRDGRVTFYPERWANEYFRWLDNVRDWTISRQLWWGHRIPVWYHLGPDGEPDDSRGFVVSVDQPAPGMVQDEDVLDTWFSSWLWPFATLGWPDKTADLQKFYPSTVLVSGYDILFFWIARMIMAGLRFTGEAPFRDVFITGMIKDKQGRWMSKSLGNGIDPLDMIELYGADAVRFSLVMLCAQGQDIRLDPARFEMGRNFANKLWNAFNVFGRFLEADAAGRATREVRRTRPFADLPLVERWMLTRLHETVRAVDEAVSRYRLNEAAALLYDLAWRDYCDWFLELVKPAPGEVMDEEALALAVEVYEALLKLLHPFMPHVTEALWWRLRPRASGDACIVAAWPKADEIEADAEAARLFGLIQEVVTGIRSVRAQYNVPPSKRIAAALSMRDDVLAGRLGGERRIIERMAGVEGLEIGVGLAKPPASAAVVVAGHEVFVPLAGLIDLGAERARLEREIGQKKGFLQSVEAKLGSDGFVARAPAEVVAKERRKADDARAELAKLRANLAGLG